MTVEECKMLYNALYPYYQFPFTPDDIKYKAGKIALICDLFIHRAERCPGGAPDGTCMLQENIDDFKRDWSKQINQDPNPAKL